MKYILHM